MKTYSVPVYACKMVRERTLRLPRHKTANEVDAAAVARAMIGDADREHMIALFLNGRNEITGVHTVAIGGLHGVQVEPRTIIKAALVANAHAVIMAHNHPSGDPTPSQEDVTFTRRMLAISEVVGVPILDHVIVTRTGHHSMSSHGTLRFT